LQQGCDLVERGSRRSIPHNPIFAIFFRLSSREKWEGEPQFSGKMSDLDAWPQMDQAEALEGMVHDTSHNVASGLVPDEVPRRAQGPTLQHWTVTRSGCLCEPPRTQRCPSYISGKSDVSSCTRSAGRSALQPSLVYAILDDAGQRGRQGTGPWATDACSPKT
jgi:hypothetical protein